nr:thioredoxin domain-containing protein [Desulfobulbaceae bacterium]
MERLIVDRANTIEHFVASEIEKGHLPNKLISEKSPYLLQHAFNPVHWHPWGEEAFSIAVKDDKPIFLSIGYSTCHWCHVMEKESFENPEIAAILNKYFISIKVDREERPDLDQVYMAVTQAMAGSGGWPMSVFLTPELLPFYAGTYFPPEPKYGRPGLPELLNSIHNAWQLDKKTIVDKAGSIVKQLSELENRAPVEGYVLNDFAIEAARQFKGSYDSEYGGFGSSPKFPRPVVFSFLFRHGQKNNDQRLIDMGLETIRNMAHGGMYDHLGGGFHRYSVDRYWRVPHFEKMLYDQALLAVSALEAYQISKDSFFADLATDTIDFVLREMTSADGAFYSALDADSPVPENPEVKSEGAFYLWSHDEISATLSPVSARVFSYRYGVLPEGNTLDDPHGDFGVKNVLFAAHTQSQTATKFALSEIETATLLNDAKVLLDQKRNQRPHPHLDDKILASWNGLMVSALAKGAVILDNQHYLEAANKAAKFLQNTMINIATKQIFHRYRDGEAGIAGQLDDYAFVCQGFIDLYEATFNPQWLVLAKMLTETQLEQFADNAAGGFFESSGVDSSVILKMKTDYDGAEPAGNSVSALNLLRLGQIFDSKYTEIAEKAVRSFSGVLKAGASAMPQMLAAVDFMESKPLQIIIAGNLEALDTKVMQKTVATYFLPNKVLLSAGGKEFPAALQKLPDYWEAMTMVDGKATAYICKELACQPPTNDPVQLEAILSVK